MSGSVIIREDGRSYHFNTNDPLCDGHAHDAFDIFCHFEHNGDAAAAVKALSSPPATDTPRQQGPNPPTAGSVAAGDTDKTPSGSTEDEVLSVSVAESERPASFRPYRPFPVHCLPDPIKQFVTAAASALGVDPAYIGIPLLVAAGAAIGNSRVVQLKPGWAEPPVLWGVCIGDSGSLKSPSLDLALRFVRRRQDRLLREHNQEVARYERELRIQPRGSRGPEPERPRPCERTWVSDVTVEAIADRLLDSPRGLLVSADELAAWIGSYDQYKARAQGSDVARWLDMHRAGPLLIDRKSGDRRTTHIPRAAVSVVGGIQPGALARRLTPEFFENGLAARLLLAYPPRRPKRWTDDEVDPQLAGRVEAVFERLFALKPECGVGGAPEPLHVPLSDLARRMWAEFVNDVGRQQFERADEHVVSALAKLEACAARFALILHELRHAVGDEEESRWWVDDDSVAGGIELFGWFKYEMERVYSLLKESDQARALRRLIELIRNRGGTISVRELMRARSCYKTADAAKATLDGLVTQGYGWWEHPPAGPSGGAPTAVFVLSELTE